MCAKDEAQGSNDRSTVFGQIENVIVGRRFKKYCHLSLRLTQKFIFIICAVVCVCSVVMVIAVLPSNPN